MYPYAGPFNTWLHFDFHGPWALIYIYIYIYIYIICCLYIILYICCAQSLSHVQLFVILRTGAYQAPLSMEFSLQQYWSGLPFLSPRHLPNPGIEPLSPALAGRFFTTAPPRKL